MGMLCIAAAGLVLSLPLSSFTLAWTHSIEKIRWEEDYRLERGRLVLDEARIRGSGAGMEPPPDAVLRNGVWHYKPDIAPLATLRLTRSPFTADYQLCHAGQCRPFGDLLGQAATAEIVELSA